jgi:hypothetical protein
MKLSIDSNKVCWHHGGNLVAIDEPFLWHAIYACESNVIVTLGGERPGLSRITIYELNGDKRLTVHEPENLYFNCIGANRGCAIAVMVKVYKSSWCDWWYSVDPITGDLAQLGEGR